MTAVRLCSDCKHSRPDLGWGEAAHFAAKYATCFLTAKVSEHDGDRCSYRRHHALFNACGARGKQWEPK